MNDLFTCHPHLNGGFLCMRCCPLFLPNVTRYCGHSDLVLAMCRNDRTEPHPPYFENRSQGGDWSG